jgi:aromatic ring hydroxylase
MLAKYLKGVEGIPAENRVRVMWVIENLTLGLGPYAMSPNLYMARGH